MAWRGSLIAGAIALAVLCLSCTSDGAGRRALAPKEAAAENVATEAPTPVAQLLVPPTPAPTPAKPRPPSNGVPVPAIEAGALLVVDEGTGATLYESNADVRLAPASLTKIATAIVVLESGADLDTVIEVHPNLEQLWLEDSSSMGLLPGDQFSIRELLYGLLLVSGNDAAKELAIALYGSEEAFVREMNALAKRLDLRNTHFIDPHGLGGPGHYTTARDLARLSEFAMTFPLFREIVATETHTSVGSQEIPLYNFNPLLNYTPGVTGIKTGYTEEAGPTFIVSVEREGHRILVVMLNIKGFPFTPIDLIEWAYADTRWE